jgi:hypothetical protein
MTYDTMQSNAAALRETMKTKPAIRSFSRRFSSSELTLPLSEDSDSFNSDSLSKYDEERKSERKVSFPKGLYNEDRYPAVSSIKDTLSFMDYTPEEVAACWWHADDMREAKLDCQALVHEFLCNDQPNKDMKQMRGLEKYLNFEERRDLMELSEDSVLYTGDMEAYIHYSSVSLQAAQERAYKDMLDVWKDQGGQDPSGGTDVCPSSPLKRTRSGSSKLKQIFTKRLGLKLR